MDLTEDAMEDELFAILYPHQLKKKLLEGSSQHKKH